MADADGVRRFSRTPTSLPPASVLDKQRLGKQRVETLQDPARTDAAGIRLAQPPGGGHVAGAGARARVVRPSERRAVARTVLSGQHGPPDRGVRAGCRRRGSGCAGERGLLPSWLVTSASTARTGVACWPRTPSTTRATSPTRDRTSTISGRPPMPLPMPTDSPTRRSGRLSGSSGRTRRRPSAPSSARAWWDSGSRPGWSATHPSWTCRVCGRRSAASGSPARSRRWRVSSPRWTSAMRWPSSCSPAMR